jgi:predicted phosphohydrolase
MMTGIPPPRSYDYRWQISRLNDKGFSQGIREIVARMLDPSMAMRPDALQLVDEVEKGWRVWRASTVEGQAYIDVRDKLVRREYESMRGIEVPGWGFLPSL